MPSSGGLVAALGSVVDRSTSWVGWSGATGPTDDLPADPFGMSSVELDLSEAEAFYDGFSNTTLWPLYHDSVRSARFEHDWWRAYRAVNRRFAARVAEIAGPGSLVWIHDYQLQLVPRLLRRRRPDVRIGYFHHIPFPPPELFSQLPWRSEVLEGLLGADVIGFQTRNDVDNFVRSANRHLGARQTEPGELRHSGRTVRIDAFPISIDYDAWDELARSPEVVARAEEMRAAIGPDRRILLGVDRLDYTKGVDLRIGAVRGLLEDGRLDPAEIAVVQIAVPTRGDSPGYGELRNEVERLVSEVNGCFATVGAPIVHYLHRGVSPVDLAALYRLCDVMVVTPLRDGMNLVAKEFVAARVDHGGALVLSEFAGAAAELDAAILVNPHDHRALQQAILDAIRLDPGSRRWAMARLRDRVSGATVQDWAAGFITALANTGRARTLSSPL